MVLSTPFGLSGQKSFSGLKFNSLYSTHVYRQHNILYLTHSQRVRLYHQGSLYTDEFKFSQFQFILSFKLRTQSNRCKVHEIGVP